MSPSGPLSRTFLGARGGPPSPAASPLRIETRKVARTSLWKQQEEVAPLHLAPSAKRVRRACLDGRSLRRRLSRRGLRPRQRAQSAAKSDCSMRSRLLPRQTKRTTLLGKRCRVAVGTTVQRRLRVKIPPGLHLCVRACALPRAAQRRVVSTACRYMRLE